MIFFLMGILFLTGCTLPAPAPEAARDFILVTDAPNISPSPTPFQPKVATDGVPSQTTIPATLTFTPPPTKTPIPSPTNHPPPIGNVQDSHPQYTLNATLDYAARTLDVDETIFYTNQSLVSLDKLVLAVEPNRWGNCFHLESLTLNGFNASSQLNGARMEIPLGTPLQPGESITLELSYLLNIPPKSHAEVFGYLSDFQMNIVNWYPFIVPFDVAKGWLIHEPSGVGEHLVYETSDFDVTLKIEGDDDLVVAASAAGKKAGAWRLYELEGARAFVFSVSSVLHSQTVASENASVTSFYFPDYEKAGVGILEAASQAIDIYSDRFAPYPYEHLSIVQTHLPDGMEYDGLIFMGSEFYDDYNGTIKNNLVAIGVHEVSHQWWFGLVGNDQALEPWLDEALALYSERIYYETIYPYPVNWWWRFRVTWFSPSGWVDTGIYDGYAFRGYTDAVYLRGAQFLEAIRFRVGEKAFNAFLQDYTNSFSVSSQ
ncbi:MAG: hypothetical protein HN391_14465 [Anaerolineae bacterium]|nr:hypothetical protein [Anaerolineae bacterium]